MYVYIHVHTCTLKKATCICICINLPRTYIQCIYIHNTCIYGTAKDMYVHVCMYIHCRCRCTHLQIQMCTQCILLYMYMYIIIVAIGSAFTGSLNCPKKIGAREFPDTQSLFRCTCTSTNL